MRGIIERLKWCREDIEAWIEREYRIIARENKLKTWPKPRLGVIKLEEERAFKQILMNLYDRNILSAQTVLAETGYEYVTEIERLEKNKVREEEGFIRKSVSAIWDGWSDQWSAADQMERPKMSRGTVNAYSKTSGSGQGKRVLLMYQQTNIHYI